MEVHAFRQGVGDFFLRWCIHAACGGADTPLSFDWASLSSARNAWLRRIVGADAYLVEQTTEKEVRFHAAEEAGRVIVE